MYKKEDLDVKDCVRMVLEKRYFYYKWDWERGLDAEGIWEYFVVLRAPYHFVQLLTPPNIVVPGHLRACTHPWAFKGPMHSAACFPHQYRVCEYYDHTNIFTS